jgi:hypothetical protein
MGLQIHDITEEAAPTKRLKSFFINGYFLVWSDSTKEYEKVESPIRGIIQSSPLDGLEFA